MCKKYITVQELKEKLQNLSDSDKIYLPGGLTFYRLNQGKDGDFYIEPNEPEAYISDKFKEKNPHIKVAFMSIDHDAEIDVELK